MTLPRAGPLVSPTLAALQAKGLPRLDAQLLLLHALGQAPHNRAWLLAHDTDEVSEAAMNTVTTTAQRRLHGEPLAYITGHKEFYGLDLQVDKRVLDPRPDTETLVDWALEVLQPQSTHSPRVLDLGTGSGAIALAIAHSLQAAGRPAQITAVDASTDALDVARSNAARLGLTIDFVESSWLAQVTGRFHLIASNPPYIASADPHLAALVHEPLQALTAGADGLDDLRQIIAQAPSHLLPGGWLLLEHGYDQASRVRDLLAQRGFSQVQSRLDLAGIERCSGGQWRQ